MAIMGTMFNPWGIVAENPWITVHRVAMPEGVPGGTDGRGIIWLDRDLSRVERRCVLTHELVHLGRGHESCQPPAQEWRVREATARLLLPLECLRYPAAHELDLYTLADELAVTPFVLADRLKYLTPAERGALWRVDVFA